MVGADGVKVPVVTAAEKQKRRANKRRRRKARRSPGAPGLRRTVVRRHSGSDQGWKEFKIVHAAAAACFGEESPAARQWAQQASEAVKTEGASGLLVHIHQTRRSVRSPRKREALRQLDQYAAKRAEMLDYPTFLAEGVDIGSGPTEAFCKTLTLRLKGSGMRWDTPNAEALMTLAALDQSNLWTAYWKRQNARAA